MRRREEGGSAENGEDEVFRMPCGCDILYELYKIEKKRGSKKIFYCICSVDCACTCKHCGCFSRFMEKALSEFA